MLKLISMYKKDSKETVKFDFVTSCLAFRDLIITYLSIELISLALYMSSQRVQVMGSLQNDKLFIVGSWI